MPILLTESMEKQLNLMTSRSQAGILPINVYVFAQQGSDTCIRSHDCLQLNAQKCGAEKPDLITSTCLRTHMATVTDNEFEEK